MKKTAIAIGLAAMFSFSACRNEKKAPDPAPATPPVENPAPAPQPTAAEEIDGTDVSADKNGAGLADPSGSGSSGEIKNTIKQ
ncbi:MAG TPA: hypothetical protein VFR70_07915 [Flavobacterium sp.]|nr:hypothetical protein [Flavobacterium sp.]